jgi:F0F1-type ATP synthase membrane subunit c/vacuolar-type H+-ATPase subunit K
MITRRQLVGAAAALAVGLAMAGSAFAADITGKWKSEFTGPDGNSRTNVFTFEVKGETVTGTVTSSMAPEPAKIEDGTLKGDAIAFKVTRDMGGNQIKLNYTGTVKGDEMPLKVSADAGGQTFAFDIVAKREK